ncbi:hypothetical protein ADP71_26580 [Vitreoscilla sp. C1]|uniref:PH domain-containing protein n=1 Tax=Vitreoscilla sp. (strain C1) TaxID=96942 RepID=UPI00148EC18D|nr:PH domain-containing protein [Vitreoscilla sp. C1]AUZ05943.2 hypothetical protein ADP71_26580 [Vitreoscilla sp. C1]
MSLFSGLMGNASEAKSEKWQEALAQILADGEMVDSAYQVLRDTLVLTNKRVIFIDKQGVTGKKTEYLSIPYKNIVTFSIESAGTFDLESELKLWVSGRVDPIETKFGRGGDILKAQKALAKYVLGL